MRCRVCGNEFEGNYCPNCGSAALSREIMDLRVKEGIRNVGSVIWLVSIISFIIIISAAVIILFYGLSIIVPNILATGSQTGLFLITPVPIIFIMLEGYWFVGWYLFLFTVILLSFIVLFYSSSRPAWKLIKKPLPDLKGRLGSTNAISMITQLFLAIIFFTISYYLILELINVGTSTPGIGELSQWKLLYVLANASVYEEIITRILFIGVPLSFIHFSLGMPMKGRIHKYVLGGGFELKRGTIFLLLFSSFMFALAHISGWDWYKVPPTFIAGLALGYLYLRKGIFASIMLHFTVDYFSAIGELLPTNLTVTLVWGTIILILVLLGSFFFIYYLLKVYHFFSTKPQAPAQTPVVQEKKSFFVCPKCGGMEARYSEDTFECLNCGFKL